MTKRLTKFDKFQLIIRSTRPMTLAEKAIEYRQNLIQNETPAETQFKKYLNKLKIKYEFQKIVFAGRSFYIVDFFIPKHTCVIELDGSQHYTDEGKKDDSKRTKQLKKVGVIEVYRFTNEEVFEEIECVNRIKKLLKLDKKR